MKEIRLRHELKAVGFPVDDAHRVRVPGRKRAIRGDIVCPEWKLIIEYDGKRWHCSKQAVTRDTDNTIALTDAGWTVIRVRDGLEPLFDNDVPLPWDEAVLVTARAVIRKAAALGFVIEHYNAYLASTQPWAIDAADTDIGHARLQPRMPPTATKQLIEDALLEDASRSNPRIGKLLGIYEGYVSRVRDELYKARRIHLYNHLTGARGLCGRHSIDCWCGAGDTITSNNETRLQIEIALRDDASRPSDKIANLIGVSKPTVEKVRVRLEDAAIIHCFVGTYHGYKHSVDCWCGEGDDKIISAARLHAETELCRDASQSNQQIAKLIGDVDCTWVIADVRRKLEQSASIHCWQYSGGNICYAHSANCWCGQGDGKVTSPKRTRIAEELRRDATRSDIQIAKLADSTIRIVRGIRHELESSHIIHRWYRRRYNIRKHRGDCWCSNTYGEPTEALGRPPETV